MNDLIVCAIFKDEAHILYEWICHYLARGVSRVYLVNDFSTDNFADITNTFGDSVVVMHNDIVTNDAGRQMMICEKYFRPILMTSKWVALVDLDEFLYSPETVDLNSVLDRHDNHNQVLVDWLHFGSSGHVYQPQSVVEGFRMRAHLDTTKPYYSYKSIFKGNSLVKFKVHSHEVTGTTHHEHSALLINHYTIQSLNFFMTVKATRGDVNNHFPLTGARRDRAYFDSYDINVVEDRRLSDQNKEITEVVKSIKKLKI
jgi:glycosyltransferase involved in cell wall biosynthesis